LAAGVKLDSRREELRHMVYRHTRRRGERNAPHPTRERILDITVELIGEVGLEAVDITEVLKRADVTTGALYHHFRDVPHLLEEAMARRFPIGVQESLAMIRQGLEAASTLEEYQTFMRTLTEVSQAPANRPRRMERAHYLALAFGSDTLHQVIAQQQADITADLAEVLADVQQRGWLRKDLNPKAVAVFIQAYTLGRIIDDITDDPVDPADWNYLISAVMADALSEPS
jgi:AcrR family transcriptional regulator